MTLKHAERDLKKIIESLSAMELTVSQVYERLECLRSNLQEFSRDEIKKEVFELMSMLEEV